MFDIFYFGPKPNLYAFEKPAASFEDAAQQAKTKFFWYIYGGNDYTGFNFDFTPVPWQEHYTHVWGDQHNNNGNVYLTANPTAPHHYHDENRVHRLPNINYYAIQDNIDRESIDWRWSPNPLDPPYIYHFPSQHQSASGVTYRVPGATTAKLIDAFIVKALPNKDNWTVADNIDTNSVDFSWHPNPTDPPYIYHFPSQHQGASGVTYTVPGATTIKVVSDFVTRAIPQHDNWITHRPVKDFDYSWHPNPLDPAYNYIWGNQWYAAEYDPTVEYRMPSATETKYMHERATCTPVLDVWDINDDVEDFDYSWHPNPVDPPFIYAFGNQWMPPEVRTSLTYAVAGATEIKYMQEPKAYRKGSPEKFITHYPCKFDYSWEPDPGSPPYNYVWGNQWWPAEKMATVEYRMPGASETKYMGQSAVLLPTSENWVIHTDVPVDFDFSWCPDPNDPPYNYVFGNQHWEGERSATIEYIVPGATTRKFIQDVSAKLEVLDIFFVDRGNPTAQSRYDLLVEKYPTAHKVRYANSIYDTIKRCVNRAKTPKFWIVSSEYNYADFDFDWQPEPWQNSMTHVFPSQHNKWSDTFLINKWEFERHSTWATSLEQFPNLNFVKNQVITKTENLWDIYYIDHGNPESESQLKRLRYDNPGKDIVKTRYANDYLSVLKRIMTNAATEYVWVINSVCDYSAFDFSWQPEPWQKEMIHCFSNERGAWDEKRGDTFYIHVESFKTQMVELELLDWFNVINYVETQYITRWTVPAVEYTGDNLVQAIKDYNFTTPYAVFANREFGGSEFIVDCLWTEKDRAVRPLSDSRGISLVPRDAKKYLKTQMYDYPYLYKPEQIASFNYYMDIPLDVVYISNGEPDAEHWYTHLEYLLDLRGPMLNMPKFNNKLHRVQNVNGRVAAYQAAAAASTTPWFFAVFAKLEVDSKFDFTWQPDYWQEPKHYIFNAKNPVNGLEYGHMGMIAYNKRLVLNNNNPGIDFTLSQPHESVPILSGVAHYNQDAWTTWRTAFREVIKLRMFMDTSPTLETEHRLDVWLNKAEGTHSYYSLVGARDADRYYDAVDGNPAELQKSFDWAWLKERFTSKTDKTS